MATLPNTEKPLWREAYPGITYEPLKDDINVDVAIIGAGITGLSAAYMLKQRGKTVAVIDKDTVGGGTTGRTTGKVTSQHNLIYDELQTSAGTEVARLYGQANQAALDQIEAIIKAERIDCDWQRADNYVYTTQVSELAKLKKEAEVAKGLGLPASFETNTPLPFDTKGAVKFANQARFAAQKYVLGLAKAVHGNGSYVFEQTKAIGIHDGSPAQVGTPHGKIIAKDIIVATNVPTMPLIARGGYCILEYPTESYIVAAPYDKELEGMFISPDSGHYSLLPLVFENTRYLLIGGGGHLSGLRISKKWRFNRLASYGEKHFGITEFTHKWSDRDYIAYDKIPLAGKLYPWSKHLYVATAMKKWGLTNGTACAILLADHLTNQPNVYASKFTALRSRPITSIPKAVIEQAKQLRNP